MIFDAVALLSALTLRWGFPLSRACLPEARGRGGDLGGGLVLPDRVVPEGRARRKRLRGNHGRATNPFTSLSSAASHTFNTHRKHAIKVSFLIELFGRKCVEAFISKGWCTTGGIYIYIV